VAGAALVLRVVVVTSIHITFNRVLVVVLVLVGVPGQLIMAAVAGHRFIL
jgi:hypothetical protein